MRLFHFFAVVLRRPTGGKREKLDHVLFKIIHILRGCFPHHRLLIAIEQAAVLHSFAIPVHARILQRASREIVHNRADALLATQAVEKCKLAFHLSSLTSAWRAGIRLGLLHALFSGAFARTGELLIFGHSLLGTLVGFAAARREEI